MRWGWRAVSGRYGTTASGGAWPRRPGQRGAADVAAGLGGLAKILRMALQSGVLGIGAWLVINQQATAGIIIASSILTARALAPVEVALSQWGSVTAPG